MNMSETLGEPPKTPPMESPNFQAIMSSCYPITLKVIYLSLTIITKKKNQSRISRKKN